MVYSASATLMINAIAQQAIAKRSLRMFSVFLKIKSIKKQKIRKYTTVKTNTKTFSFIKLHRFISNLNFPLFTKYSTIFMKVTSFRPVGGVIHLFCAHRLENLPNVRSDYRWDQGAKHQKESRANSVCDKKMPLHFVENEMDARWSKILYHSVKDFRRLRIVCNGTHGGDGFFCRRSLLTSFHFPLFFQQQLYKILLCSQTANRLLNLRAIHFWIGFRR